MHFSKPLNEFPFTDPQRVIHSVDPLIELVSGAINTGDEKDESRVFVESSLSTLLQPPTTLHLTTIFVPHLLRRQGLCKRILDIFEKKCDREGLVLIVGPIMEDNETGTAYVGDLCKKRGYHPCMPFCYFRRPI